MAAQDDKRPYAAAANVISVIHRGRTRNLPDRIDTDFLRLVGMPEVVYGRVAAALNFLELTEEDGTPTDTLQAIVSAPDDQYRELLAAAVRTAYESDFKRVDPSQDTQAQIIDAFRPYQPRSQTKRMVTLFLALCREAGIPVKEMPRERAMKGQSGKPSAASRSAPATSKQRKPRSNADSGHAAVINHHQATTGLVFGVTEDDLSFLSDEQFSSVWGALGTVARARALARRGQDRAAGDSGKTVPESDGSAEVTA